MQLRLFHVDAFTDRVFAGNPAAVCPLDQWLPDPVLQAIAAENALSETAFFVREGDAFRIRWMTPTVEVDLCGHATLATAHVLFERLGHPGEELRLSSRSGPLRVLRRRERLVLDFPSRPAQPCAPVLQLVEGLGRAPRELLAAPRDFLAVFDREADVRALRPRMDLLTGLDREAVIATAPGDQCHFVSRFFGPAIGVPEDPVTGSAHCTLAPFWSRRLGKSSLHARQVSARGGELWCEDRGERVEIGGRAVIYLEGTLRI